jgi:5-methyltetrahydrofolate--homocysteine methyltransferase
LVMPIGAVRYAGRQVFHIVRRCREELGVNTCCGASNVSFGLPNRAPLNATFLAMAIGAGLTSAITNPIEPEIRRAIMAADVMMGYDENCAAWIDASRQDGTAQDAEKRRRPRRRQR